MACLCPDLALISANLSLPSHKQGKLFYRPASTGYRLLAGLSVRLKTLPGNSFKLCIRHIVRIVAVYVLQLPLFYQ